ncbi:MAG: DNA translocase FtsK [Cryomorphaceae bacterium]|nr:MAG: DNA translocase FtsK [Cryomorphaceae bacterium]
MAAKSSAKKNTKTKGSTLRSVIGSVLAFLQSERFKRIIGLLLLLITLFITVAMCSFFFTWKHDQSQLSGSWWEFMMNPEIEVENWLGKFGALLSHLLIHAGFGVMSFGLVLITGLTGLRILFKTWVLPIGKTLSYLLALFLLVPLTLTAMFGVNHPYLGGAFGYHVHHWLHSALGGFGTGALVFFGWVGFLMVGFNLSPQLLTGLFGSTYQRFFRSGGVSDSEENPVAEPEQEAEIPDESDFEGRSHDVIDDLLSDDEDDIDEAELEFTVRQVEPETPVEEADQLAETPRETQDAGSADDELEVEVSSPEAELSEEEIEDRLKNLEDYDPTLDLSSYEFPKLDILEKHGDGNINVDKEELEANKNKIVETLGHYKIGVSRIKATIGPTVTLYEIVPEAGVRISKIKNLEDDIALSLAALGIRIIAPIPGRGTIGIEVPNSKPEVVSMRSLIASDKFQNSDFELPLALGKTISNETFVTDLAKMPHLLMAGATGQGKSVGLNAILVSLLYKKHPSQIKFVLVDPKKVELTLFNKIERHFLAKLPDTEEAIITDTSKVVTTLNSLCVEMDERYELLKMAQVRNIKEYNAKFVKRRLNPEEGHRFLPYIVLVVDEFADLIMTAGKEVEGPIARLAQLARAIGIHLIIATQRPSVNVITGIIKANFPARIAFRVTSKIDSRTILDAGGADQLIGRGDMLLSLGNEPTRIQCGFVDTPEVEEITQFIGSQRGYPSAYFLPEYQDESSGGMADFDDADRDDLFEDAARVVVIHQQGSASLLQRKLKLGYNRAGRIIDQLEAAGVVGPFEGSKARQVLIPDEYSLEQFLNREQSDN